MAALISSSVAPISLPFKDRRDGLISTPKNGRIVVEDWARLKEVGEFDPTYLHLKQEAA